MKYTTDTHQLIISDDIMQRNYSNFLSYENGKTKCQINYEMTFEPNQPKAFIFFTDATVSIYEPYILSEGDIFTAINDNNVTYIIENSIPVEIPNAKTLDVLLFKRGLTRDNIKRLEDSEIVDIIAFKNGTLENPIAVTLSSKIKIKDDVKKASSGGGGGGSTPPKLESKENEWTPDMELTTISEQYAELSSTAASADSLLNDSLEQINSVMDVAIADAQSSKAEADAAKATAEASKAASEAAIAEAEASKAEAEATQAEYEYKMATT